MDLESFLELEKRRLAEDREHLQQSYEQNSYISIASMAPVQNNNTQPTEEDSISKTAKDWINNQYNKKVENVANTSNSYNRKNQVEDDMEQWVSDTFYSYFPGFNNEYQKRQTELQKRQRENEVNLIKHQMLNKEQSRKNKHSVLEISNGNSAHSNNSSLTSNGGNSCVYGAGKTDLEIINVNNPNYIPSKHSSNSLRPDSARYRHLQGLRHTNLTNLVHDSPEEAKENIRRQAAIESERKKEYQRELMQQIEEKRRTIKLLRDKEHQQEEVLTRRLQEQLKTMKLEEQLEKDRIKEVKVRFDVEQNRLNREYLLAKLENDSQLISNDDLNAISCKKYKTANSEINIENVSNREDNKVYKYFSNSQKHEYNYRNKSSSLPSEVDFELDEIEMAKIEKECFHLSEKICPMCNEPLKELQNFCLRCQSKLSFRIKSPLSGKDVPKPIDTEKSQSIEDDADKNTGGQVTESGKSFFLICIRCEHLYSWCKTCTRKSDLCKACQNKRNLCMTCRKTLCSFCLEEVACGKDSETVHINDKVVTFDNKGTPNCDSPSEKCFKISNNSEGFQDDNKNSNLSSFSAEYSSLNDLDCIIDPPFSINIEHNSVYNPDKQFSIYSAHDNQDMKHLTTGVTNSSLSNKDYLQSSIDERNIETLCRDTDKRLSVYLKNYGDLAYQTRGTQTTPTTTGRRDIVIQGEHSLSIPLLREMPKMTRMEAKKIKENSKEMEDLQRRWDIPAVQKHMISPLSPKVVTQVGAIRKHLQIERLFSDDTDT